MVHTCFCMWPYTHMHALGSEIVQSVDGSAAATFIINMFLHLGRCQISHPMHASDELHECYKGCTVETLIFHRLDLLKMSHIHKHKHKHNLGSLSLFPTRTGATKPSQALQIKTKGEKRTKQKAPKGRQLHALRACKVLSLLIGSGFIVLTKLFTICFNPFFLRPFFSDLPSIVFLSATNSSSTCKHS
ncbi:uncharacterized protein J3R85_010061 [Psidium guajava]|nr:uncharacterized protein J3R85_010061 [Psidium guajava]